MFVICFFNLWKDAHRKSVLKKFFGAIDVQIFVKPLTFVTLCDLDIFSCAQFIPMVHASLSLQCIDSSIQCEANLEFQAWENCSGVCTSRKTSWSWRIFLKAFSHFDYWKIHCSIFYRIFVILRTCFWVLPSPSYRSSSNTSIHKAGVGRGQRERGRIWSLMMTSLNSFSRHLKALMTSLRI